MTSTQVVIDTDERRQGGQCSSRDPAVIATSATARPLLLPPPQSAGRSASRQAHPGRSRHPEVRMRPRPRLTRRPRGVVCAAV
ncbi:hypothetical protein [Nonomuraea dietziae]|uniref:hypothetical protein n=1 Tax=Nonomuraea dietziae TaxID=65515 RepID=UPI0031D02072